MLDTNNLISSSQSIFSKSNIFWFITPAFKSLSQYLISLACFENTVNLFMKSLFEPAN